MFVLNEFYFKMLELILSPQEGEIYEYHHVIPKAWFKRNNLPVLNENNLIKLTAQNHYKIHYYLWKCCDELIKTDMALALFNMLNTREIDLDISAKEYEEIRKQAITQRNIKVICLETKQIYNSIKETGLKHISECLNGKRKTVNGLHWEKYNPEINYSDEYINDRIKKIGRSVEQKVICLETNKIYSSIIEASKDTNINKNIITKQLNGILKTAKGTHWKKYNVLT